MLHVLAKSYFVFVCHIPVTPISNIKGNCYSEWGLNKVLFEAVPNRFHRISETNVILKHSKEKSFKTSHISVYVYYKTAINLGLITVIGMSLMLKGFLVG